MYDFYFKGKSASSHGIYAVKRISLPARKSRDESIVVPGRSGQLNKKSKYKDTAPLPAELNFITNSEKWMNKILEVERWLEGKGELLVSDFPDFFINVYSCTIDSIDRNSDRVGNLKVTFNCEPYYYAIDGKKEIEVNQKIYNPYEKSCPIYIVEGIGKFEMTVNGNTFSGTSNGRIYIDTDLMISYNDQKINQSPLVSGEYEEILFVKGDNIINITDGFLLKAIPRWRC